MTFKPPNLPPNTSPLCHIIQQAISLGIKECLLYSETEGAVLTEFLEKSFITPSSLGVARDVSSMSSRIHGPQREDSPMGRTSRHEDSLHHSIDVIGLHVRSVSWILVSGTPLYLKTS